MLEELNAGDCCKMELFRVCCCCSILKDGMAFLSLSKLRTLDSMSFKANGPLSCVCGLLLKSERPGGGGGMA